MGLTVGKTPIVYSTQYRTLCFIPHYVGNSPLKLRVLQAGLFKTIAPVQSRNVHDLCMIVILNRNRTVTYQHFLILF